VNPNPQVRAPAVAGVFYPGESGALRDTLQRLLAEPRPRLERPPKALIAPHAGYQYSGPVAASAYVELGAAARTIERVVLLGPAHRVALRGIAAPTANVFETPLGPIAVDGELRERALKEAGVELSDLAHAGEHSLEVHLPFLQTVLDDFTLLPLVVGEASPDRVAAVLERVWGGPETLIVVSTDLSHHHRYAVAQATDRETVASITRYSDAVRPEQACGCRPLNGLARAARKHGLTIHTLDVRNSGDTAGPRDAVVGYASFGLCE
jgi:AmmeMemoRadiSam system protein B